MKVFVVTDNEGDVVNVFETDDVNAIPTYFEYWGYTTKGNFYLEYSIEESEVIIIT